MEFNPFAVYRTAVKELPSLKYALGVAGVVGAAMIAYNLSNEDPRKAVLAFFFVLIGMYLLLIFASIGREAVVIVRGPFTAIIWAVTIFFIACLFLTLTAYMFGWPEPVAKLVGATPASLRSPMTSKDRVPGEPSGTTQPSSGPPTIDVPQANQATSTSPPRVPTLIPVEETFRISDSSDDCAVNRVQTQEFCLSSPAILINWTGPQIESANCGSLISNARVVSSKANCVAVDVSLRGCGYDDFLVAKNCRGRGWIGGTLTLHGNRSGD